MKTYDNWIEAKQNAKYWNEKEKECRIKICNKLLEGKEVGTHNIRKGIYDIKITKKVNYTIDADQLALIWDELSYEEQEAIKYKPSLLLNQYKKLDEDNLLSTSIEVKPAMPTLEIEVIE